MHEIDKINIKRLDKNDVDFMKIFIYNLLKEKELSHYTKNKYLNKLGRYVAKEIKNNNKPVEIKSNGEI